MTLRTRVVERALRTLVRPVLGRPVPLAVQRRYLALTSVGAALPTGTTVARTTLGGRPAEVVSGRGRGPGAVLLLHGGAFITCSPRTHRVLAAHLSAAAGAAVHVPDYRLAPEHPWPAPVQDAVAAYDQLAAAGPVAVVGDSAGGCLALLLARERTPVALGLVSPLVDLTRSMSSRWDGRDAVIRPGWVDAGCTAFAGGADLTALSPLGDDLSGLPPTLVHLSEHERLRPEGERWVQRAREAGVDVSVELLAGLWHDAHLLSHLVPQAAQATARLGAWVGGRLRAEASRT